MNILLPEDTVTKLDELQTRAGFRSRGRTVQDIVDTVMGMVDETKDTQNLTESCFLRAIQSDPAALSTVGVVLINMTNIIKRLGRYQPYEPTNKEIEAERELSELIQKIKVERDKELPKSDDNLHHRVLEYIKKHKTLDIIELHKEMKCDIRTLIEVLDELIAEGKMREVEPTDKKIEQGNIEEWYKREQEMLIKAELG